MLLCNQQLTKSQLEDLDQLAKLCQTSDEGLPSIYYHLLIEKRDTASNVLYYEKENLVGFLSVYFFYEEACEISLLIAPMHRHQGIACELLRTIMPLLSVKNITKVIFSSSASFRNQWKPSEEFTYHQSEYHMERNSFETLLISNPNLNVRKAHLGDMEALCRLDSACFHTQQTTMVERFSFLLNDNNYTLLIAFHKSQPIGKAHIRWETHGALFSDIAIIPEQQGKGFGSELLAHCINQALSIGKIKLELDVETDNQNALNLYVRHGFKTSKVYDYWSVTIEKLSTFLQMRIH